MRRPLPLLLLTLAALLAAPGTASAQDLLTPACGSAGGALPVLDPVETEDTGEIRVDWGGTLPVATVDAIFETVHDRVVGDFGWTAPASTGARFHVRSGSGLQSGVRESGTYAGTAGDEPETTCIVVPADIGQAALREFAAREYAKASWHALGALDDGVAPAAWLQEGAAELMEDEVLGDATPDAIPPLWGEPLATYPDAGPAATSWLVLRGLTERFGTGDAGGPEDVIQGTFGRVAAGTAANLAALGAAVAAEGVPLERAFNDYAVAAYFMKACAGAYAASPCFEDAAAYLSGGVGGRVAHATVAGTGAPYAGSVPAGLALRWVALPAGPYDLSFRRTGAAGTVTGAVACDTGSGLVVQRLGTVGAGTTTVARNVDCAKPLLAVSSDAGAGAARGFEIGFAAPTTVLTVQRFGDGLVASSPAGIDCGAVCEAVYPRGAAIVLGALPAAGSAFTGWAGDCTGTGACRLAMDAHRVVAAGFGATGGPAVPSGPGASEDSTAPRMLISRPRFKRARKVLSVKLTCPADEVSSCTAPVKVVLRVGRKRHRFDGQAVVGVAPGRSARVSWAVPSAVRKRLRRSRRARITVIANARDEAFNRLTTKRTWGGQVHTSHRPRSAVWDVWT